MLVAVESVESSYSIYKVTQFDKQFDVILAKIFFFGDVFIVTQ